MSNDFYNEDERKVVSVQNQLSVKEQFHFLRYIIRIVLLSIIIIPVFLVTRHFITEHFSTEVDDTQLKGAYDSKADDLESKGAYDSKKVDMEFKGYEVEKDEYGYYTCKFKVKNISGKNIKFQGINICVLDKNGDIIDSRYTYNQQSVDAEVEPGQSITFENLFEVDSGIEQIKSTSYVYDDENGEFIEKKFPKPIIMDIKK